MFRAVLFAIVLGLGTVSAKAAQVGSYTLGNWSVGIYTNDATGAFSSCIADVSYRSGISMIVLVDRSFAWNLGFSSSAWRLRPGERISIKYRFDRSHWTGATAEAISETTVSIPMPSDGAVASMFRRGRTMEVSDGHQSFYFDLTGTSRLMVSLVDCVEKRLRMEQAVVADRQASPAVPNNAALRLEGTRVLSNFLLAANVSGAEIVATEQAEDSLAFAHAIAVADNLIAFAHVVPSSDGSPDQVAAEISARVSEGCSGKFGSGSTKEAVEDVVLISAFAACQAEGSSDTYLQFAVTGRQPSGQYVLGILFSGKQFGNGADSADPAPVTTDRLVQAAYRASQ